jgi:hypothetical protein
MIATLSLTKTNAPRRAKPRAQREARTQKPRWRAERGPSPRVHGEVDTVIETTKFQVDAPYGSGLPDLTPSDDVMLRGYAYSSGRLRSTIVGSISIYLRCAVSRDTRR